ncbi:MAG: hypothetical protein WCE21_00225 [Candidatus Babeliales bacterium]
MNKYILLAMSIITAISYAAEPCNWKFIENDKHTLAWESFCEEYDAGIASYNNLVLAIYSRVEEIGGNITDGSTAWVCERIDESEQMRSNLLLKLDQFIKENDGFPLLDKTVISSDIAAYKKAIDESSQPIALLKSQFSINTVIPNNEGNCNARIINNASSIGWKAFFEEYSKEIEKYKDQVLHVQQQAQELATNKKSENMEWVLENICRLERIHFELLCKPSIYRKNNNELPEKALDNIVSYKALITQYSKPTEALMEQFFYEDKK